jgi:iron(III) transport system ATP-binding protein
MVFQSYALLPHYNIYDNVAYGLKLRKMDKATIREKVTRILKLVGLEGMEERMTNQLSGGQQQRVAIARALINMPDIVFADEPTGNLDRANADEVLKLLLETKRVMGQTLVMVTHDLAIAEHADRIFRMDNGELKLHRDYVAGNKKTINTY